MWSKFLSVIVLLSVTFADEKPEDNDNALIVETSTGPVKGAYSHSLEDKQLEQFLGIPYAKPPIGDLRFSPPVPVDHWKDTLDATEFGNPCIQLNVELGVLHNAGEQHVLEGSSEDCLYLNIWTPHPRPKNAPVFVILHGGWDFEEGSGSFPKYNGANLAAGGDIIVINLNYRLAAFGFLYLGIPEAPGNVGLMDQALALKWVHDNVAHFGGDPDKITLGGEGSGGNSVGLHMLIPHHHDYYRNVVFMDGVPVEYDLTEDKHGALHLAHQLADHVGCSTATKDYHKLLSCLREKPAADIRNVIVKSELNQEEVFAPVVDGHYIPDDPLILLKQGKAHHDLKALLITSHHRGFLVNHYYIGQEPDEHWYPGKHDFEKLIDEILLFPNDYLKTAFLHAYTDWTSPKSPEEIRSETLDFSTDAYFVCPTNLMADELALFGHDVYLGHMNQRSSKSKAPHWAGYPYLENLDYAFGAAHIKNNYTAEEEIFSHKVMAGLVNFIRTGNPNDPNLKIWERYNLRDKPYMNIQEDFKIKHFLRATHCAFWNKAYPRIEKMSELLDREDHH